MAATSASCRMCGASTGPKGTTYEPAAERPAESHAGGPCDRYVRHDRLAGEEYPGEQRQGRHPRHFIRRLPAADGAGESASGAQSVGADEPDGRRLDGRRLVPQRAFRQQNLPYIYEQEATRDNDEQVVERALRRLRPYMEAGSAGELAQRHGMEQIGFWRKILAHPSYDAFWRDQAVEGCSPRSR